MTLSLNPWDLIPIIPLPNSLSMISFLRLPYSGYTVTALKSLAIGEAVVDGVMGEGVKNLYCHVHMWSVLTARTAC